MPAAKAPALALVCGDDEFAVKKRAREIYQQWCDELGGMDHEIIEATVSNSGDALKAVAKLREALQTLPFFGSGKVVWLRDCNFLGDGKTAEAKDVSEMLAEMAEELKTFKWQSVRLLISAGKVDKRKTFFKTLDKIGNVESCDGWSEKDWVVQASMLARKMVQSRDKEIAENAVAELINRVGPHPRQLESEIEKLCVFAGARQRIEAGDVAAICARNKTARAFALGDALGDRDLPRLLKRLDEELWETKFDPKKSEIGLLHGLIPKVRALLLLKEMLREGWVKQTPNYPYDFQLFKTQLERVPADKFQMDKTFNPLAPNPYVLYKALPQVKKYSQSELIRAMDLLLRCNQRLVGSGLDEALVLQQALVQIVAPQAVAA
jgi:DNA polymerase-3 subunit delta